MGVIEVKRGLDVPVAGGPQQRLEAAPPVRHVALMADDFVGLKPSLAVQEGDRVRMGQLLFTDRKSDGVRYTSPGCGRVAEIRRGAKRVFQSIVIELQGDEAETFERHSPDSLGNLSRAKVVETLNASGLWTALRQRPYGRVPRLADKPHSLFVQAIDTNPLAADPRVVLRQREPEFEHGLQVLRHLTDGAVYLCTAPGAELPGKSLGFVSQFEFDGPHPAGLPGTHIHLLDPVNPHKCVWHVNYQDVIAIGALFVTGRLPVERVISLAGPQVVEPRLVRTRLGASLEDLTSDQLKPGENRIISGSVLCGRACAGYQRFLGRYHLQVSVLREGREREFLGWQMPGFEKFSARPIYAAGFAADGRRFAMTTTRHGSYRAMVPIGTYEQVVPLDILPTHLLRALIVGDTEQAQALGCLELDEEDVALCTFVCPGKYDYGPMLRDCLTTIEHEG